MVYGISEIVNNAVHDMSEEGKKAPIAAWDIANTRQSSALALYIGLSCDDIFDENL